MKNSHTYTTSTFEQDLRYGGTLWVEVIREGDAVWEVYQQGIPGPPSLTLRGSPRP